VIAFCADTHIAPRLWQSLPDVKGDAYSSWAQIVESCKTNQVKCLILGGDIFDSVPTPEDVYHFLRGVDELRYAGIPVLAVQGQHARSRTLSWTGIDAHVTNLHGLKEPVRIDDYRIVGIDNCSSSELREHLSALPKSANVLVLHQMLEGVVSSGPGGFWDLKPEWVPEHIKLILMGDLHIATELKVGKQLFVYNGSTVIRSITESPEKSFILLDKWEYKREKLITRPVMQFNAFDGSETGLSKLVEGLKSLPDEGIAYVKVDPRIQDIEDVCRGANPKIHYIIRPIVITETGTELTLATGEVSLAGCLSTMVDRDADPLFYDFVMQLLLSSNPADVLTLFKAKVMEGVNA
jgi:hypothetical protein